MEAILSQPLCVRYEYYLSRYGDSHSKDLYVVMRIKILIQCAFIPNKLPWPSDTREHPIHLRQSHPTSRCIQTSHSVLYLDMTCVPLFSQDKDAHIKNRQQHMAKGKMSCYIYLSAGYIYLGAELFEECWKLNILSPDCQKMHAS